MMLLSALVFALVMTAALVSSSVFDYSVEDAHGRTVSLEQYSDAKVILIVNTASQCGYTHQNYKELQELYSRLHPNGLEIIAFPCNQFGRQEPGSNADIQAFVSSKYDITFPVLGKLEVNGAHQHPLFEYLKQTLGGGNISWNFGKFLVVKGEPVKRYPSDVSPLELEADIVSYFNSEL